MKTNVNQDKCIGCGACVGLCPEVFDFNDNGLAQTTVDQIPKDKEEIVNNAIEFCPVGAITKE